MKTWLWLILVPALVWADSNPWTLSKSPSYLDVHPDKVILLDDQTEIPQSALATPGNRLDAFLDNIQKSSDLRFIVLALRPECAPLQRELRQRIRQRGIDIGIEPWETGRAATAEQLAALNWMGDVLPDTTNDLFAAYQAAAAGHPCDIEINGDSLTILKDNTVVTGAGLDIPGNPFELLVDQTEARDGLSCLYFCRKSDGAEVFKKAVMVIARRAPKMAWNMGIETGSATALLLSPVEANPAGKTPVYFECRHNELFLISPERIDKACTDKLMEVRRQTYCDPASFQKTLDAATLSVDGQNLSFTNAFRKNYLLAPDVNARGFSFARSAFAADDLWFAAQMKNLDPDKQYVCFFVRSGSFDAFRQARKIAAWDFKLETSCELLNENEPVAIGSSNQ